MDTVSKLGTHRADRTPVGAAEATGSAKALVKGLLLVDVIAEADHPVRLPDLVAASGLPRTTVLRLLETLCDHSVLSVDSDGRYRLGSQLAAWGQRYLDGLDLREAALDVMQDLAAETDETCFLGVREGLEVRYIAKVGGTHAVRLAAQVGGRMPLYSTGIGKSLLAFAEEEVITALLAQPLVARTPNTTTDPARLAGELKRIRDQGFSTDDCENEEGVRCVAVPIRHVSGRVVAALSVSAPAYRFDLDRVVALAPRLQSRAAVISTRLGATTDAMPAEA